VGEGAKAVGEGAIAKGQELSDMGGTTVANVINRVMGKMSGKSEMQES
jgi:hypothetical protein